VQVILPVAVGLVAAVAVGLAMVAVVVVMVLAKAASIARRAIAAKLAATVEVAMV
jgi:hypothetical protein